jgi:cobalt-zinc-cadmium efflux system membrane fusion protein
MNKQIIYILAAVIMITAISGCGSKSEGTSNKAHQEEGAGHAEGGHDEEGEEEAMGEVHLSNLKFQSLSMEVDTMPVRSLSGVIEANGQLEVPPQHEATVTAILGANVTSIKVIEGDQVNKGQVLAYLSHPNLVNLQTGYIRSYSRLQYLEKELQREKRLFEEKVGSGKSYQEIQADYQSMKGEVKGYEAQLRQLNLNLDKLKTGNIYQYVPVISPIDGFIEKVKVQVGQYVDPQKEMFMIVNTNHIHADLMVFEKDVHKVKKDQKISFTVESVPGSQLTAKIYSVGKKFEQNPKAVHVHAEIDQKKDYLIPGMYINAKIQQQGFAVKALPESAIIEEEGKPYIFIGEKHQEDGKTEWAFKAVEIRTGITEDGWVEIKLLEPLPNGTQIAWNNAYYLISEMKKSQTSHSH